MARAAPAGRMHPIARLSFRSGRSVQSLNEAGTNPDDVGLIWMDIEGYEPLACHSMQALFARKVPLYMEFSPTFYGPDQSAAFVQFLAGFYEDCLIFREDDSTLAKVREIPINEKQFDVLLFDAAV